MFVSRAQSIKEDWERERARNESRKLLKIKHIQHESIVYNPVSKIAIKSGEKTDLEDHQLFDTALIDIRAISVLYRSVASVSLQTRCVIEGDKQLRLLSEFSTSFCRWSLHCKVKSTDSGKKLPGCQARNQRVAIHGHPPSVFVKDPSSQCRKASYSMD